MALDSLGLGLTLDTTLLEKADKTLENMQKNSKLIMQNLTRGFTVFNEGKISDFSQVFDNIQKSMQKLKDAKVSVDFDTAGFEKGLDLISQITLSIEKMQSAGTKQFFDPTNIYTTSKSMKEAADEVSRLKNEMDAVHEAMHDMVGTQEELNALISKMAEIKLHNPSTFAENQEFMDALARVDEINKAKAAAEAKYGDIEGVRMAERQLVEKIEIAKKELEWTKMTKAQQMAAVVSYNQRIIADEKKRTTEVESLYKNNFTRMNELFKQIDQLEKDREKVAAVGGDTSEYDKNLTFLRDELNRRIELEEQIVKTDYPKIAKIKQEMETEEFIKASKERAKLAEQEQRRDVSYANQFSKNASSVEEEAEAVRLLAEARDKLSYSTAHYDSIVAALNKRIAKHEDHIKLLTHEQKESNTLMDSVISRYIREKKEIRELNKLLKELHEKQASTGVKTAEEDKYEQDIIARRQRLWNDVNQIETDNAKHIAQLREKFDASVSEEKIKEILKTNEKEKQEYAKLLDEKYALEKKLRAMLEAGGKGTNAYAELKKQYDELDAREQQLKTKHANDLDEIEAQHRAKRNDDEVKAFIETEREKQKIALQQLKNRRANEKKYGTISGATAERLITFTDTAKNVAQHKKAIESLQKARERLDNTDQNYYLTLKKIEEALKRHHKELRLAGVESANLTRTHRGLLDIGGQLARRLALAFSVSQLTQYFRKLVEVRGQFEKTEVALTSIIGDNQKAQKLMNQTIALAIKSPFTLQQLTGYTKQLAAYQVSYEELHETTKMLADVSAGLGVEMDRLILAFGQVKAANYLRATEVRQFTEAGFNILGELAKYYNDLNGTMLKVGDVQEMVTKRMVDFGDVAAVFERVTSAGGMFYEMQSKQAETLAGQWTNLQDRIDVMFNEIGTSSEGVLKGFVSLLASAIDNWEALGQVITTVVTAFVLYKLNLLALNKAQIQNAIATQTLRKEHIALIKRQIQMVGLNKVLGKSFKNLWSTMGKGVGVMKNFLTANKWVLILTAVAAAITAVVRQYRRMQEALEEQNKAFNANASSLQKLAKEYEKITNEGGEFEEKLAKLEELSSMLEDRNLRLSIKIEDVDESNIDKIFKEESERLQKAYEFGKSLGRAIARGANEAQGNIFGWSLFGENLAEDAEDYGQSMAKLTSWGMKAQMESIENAARANYDEMGDEAKKFFAIIEKGRKKDAQTGRYIESDYEWTKRRAEALVMISILEKDIVGKNKELQRALRGVTHDTIELRHESKGIFDNLADETGGLANLRRKAKENPIEMSAQITTEVDKLDYDPATKEFLINDLHARLWITPNYVEDPNAVADDPLAKFQQDLMDARTRLKGGGKSYENFFISEDDIKKMEDFSDGLEGIQKLYDENKKTIEQLDGTSDTYSKEEKARLDALQKELRAVAKLWGYDLDKGKSGGENEALKRLKDQIKLIKDANKAYEERNKKFGKVDSQEVVTDSYKDAFKEVELAIEDIDYTNLEGVVEALENLEDEAKKAGGEAELLKAISEVKAEIGLTLKERQDRELFDQVQNIFDKYELGVEIKKIGVPADLAKAFGIETKTFDQMRDEIVAKFAEGNEEVSKILSKGATLSAEDEIKLINLIGKERTDKARESIEKVNEMEDKAQIERLKTYLKYTRDAIRERAKIKVEEMTKLKEIEETFRKAEEEAETEDDKKRVREQKASAISGVQREANEALSKMDWEEFRKSETFISLFDDLGGASDAILKKVIEDLDNFKKEWKDLPIDQMKEVIELRNKAQRALESKDSPWGEAKRLRSLIDEDGRSREQAELDSYNAEQEKARLENELEMIGLINLKRAEGTSNDELRIVLGEKYSHLLGENVDLVKREGDLTNKLIPDQEAIIDNAQDRVQNEKDLIEAYKKQEETLREIQNMANDLYDSFKELSEALGADGDSPAAIFADMGMSMANSVLNAIMLSAQLKTIETGAMAAGTALNTAMGVIGWIVMGVQLLTQVITAIAKMKDNQIVAQLEDQADIIERQRDLYEQIEEKVDKAYSVDQLRQYNDEMKRSVELEIQALEASIALEKSRKKADEDQIADWQKEIDEARKRLEESTQEMKEMVGGIFDLEDFTSGFVDAWWDAMEEGMDGLDALNDHFEDTMKDLVKKQALYKGAQKIMEQVMNAINADLEGDYDIDDWAEIERIAKKANIDLDAFLQGYKDIFNSISSGDAGGLSALQKGIQGVTEQTAQVLAAYWNSVRGYTASIDGKMDLILANMGVTPTANPQLEELINQTTILGEINTKIATMNETINGMIDSNGDVKVKAKTSLDTLVGTRANGGAGLKIVMD